MQSPQALHGAATIQSIIVSYYLPVYIFNSFFILSYLHKIRISNKIASFILNLHILCINNKSRNDFVLMPMLTDIIAKMSNVICGPIFVAIMLASGLFFTVKSNFFQFRYIHSWLGLILKGSDNKNKNKISPFAALSTALAGAMGTGNIVGVGCAIALGGPGAIFWMWVASLLAMMSIFAENVLAIIYRQKNKARGGPMYYIRYGLNSKFLAALFCIACIGSSFAMGNMTQSNSLAISLRISFGLPQVVTAIAITFLTIIVVIGGIKRIVNITEKLIPIITIVFMLGGIYVIFCNYQNIIPAIKSILNGAFSFKSVASGSGGFVIANAIKQGISKGIFSNEAGLGSSPIVYSESSIDSPVEAGMWGIIQVFIDTIVGCSITALCVLTYKAEGFTSSEGGLDICSEAFSAVLGSFGSVFVNISVVIFAFATIISWSYYGERCLEYLSGGKYNKIYKIIYCLFAGLGCVLNLNTVWNIADIFNAFMAIPNIIAIVFLSDKVFREIIKWSLWKNVA